MHTCYQLGHEPQHLVPHPGISLEDLPVSSFWSWLEANKENYANYLSSLLRLAK